ncbi:MAG: RsmE family RNA methyltransferase, partial [bacterium]
LIPEIGSVISFAEALKEAKAAGGRIVFPYECAEGIERTRKVLESIRPGEPVAVFIGPEGGFAPEEVALAKENGAEVITLGRRILRTETAAITALSILSYVLEA